MALGSVEGCELGLLEGFKEGIDEGDELCVYKKMLIKCPSECTAG